MSNTETPYEPYECFCGAGLVEGRKHDNFCAAYYKPHYFEMPKQTETPNE